LNILQTDIDEIFNILLLWRVDVLGLDEDGEEEQNKHTDTNSCESLRVSIQRSRRRSVCLLDNQFDALYGRHMMVNPLSAMIPPKGVLKVEPRTVALKKNRDRSDGSSQRPSLLNRLSVISRTSINSSHTPSFFGSCGSRKSSLTSSATGWLSSSTGKWMAKEVDVATLGNVMEAQGDSSASSSSGKSELEDEGVIIRGSAWEEKVEPETIVRRHNTLIDCSQSNKTTLKGPVDANSIYKSQTSSPNGERIANIGDTVKLCRTGKPSVKPR